MPYIKNRERLDKILDLVPDSLSGGEINYFITKLLLKNLREINYAGIVYILGILESVKLEFYRRLATPYEDKKKDEAGDVY